jgi:DMSO/TMAO reductase YedYZ molybdopterin-dependent catalytic subunit
MNTTACAGPSTSDDVVRPVLAEADRRPRRDCATMVAHWSVDDYGRCDVTMRRRVLVVVTAVGLMTVGVGATQTEAGQRKEDRVVVKGDVHERLALTAADIEALPKHTITVTFQAGTTPQTHTYTGALLLDVIDLAGPDFDPAIKNDALAHVVTATGSDGYRATVAWGELDPGFEAKQLLVATSQDGVPLGPAGPRLVVPGDLKGGRYVSDVVSLRLVDA